MKIPDALPTSLRGLFLGHAAHRDLMANERPFWRPFQAIYRAFILAGAMLGAVAGAGLFILLSLMVAFALFYPVGLVLIGILIKLGV